MTRTNYIHLLTKILYILSVLVYLCFTWFPAWSENGLTSEYHLVLNAACEIPRDDSSPLVEQLVSWLKK